MSKNKHIGYLLARNIEAAANAGRGHSKRANRAKGLTSERVYSDDTRQNYVQSCKTFGKWIKNTHPEAYRNLTLAKGFVPEYLGTIKNPGSRMAAAAGLAKGYGLSGGAEWGVNLGKRPLSDITRGRKLSARAAAWRVNHADVAEALRCSGLRCSEAGNLLGRDVYQRPDGCWVAFVKKGKGGRTREAVIWTSGSNTAGRDWIINHARVAGPNGYVFSGVPDLDHANTHALRADYAVRMYQFYVNLGYMASGKLYRPQDRKGTSWDKGILAAVSSTLGHGDKRCSTLYYNYLSYGRADTY